MDLLQKEYIEKIFKEYDEGKTLSEIAKKFGKKKNRIKMDLLELGGEKGKKILIESLDKEIELSESVIKIYEEYIKDENISIKTIAQKYNVSYGKMVKVIKQYEYIIGSRKVYGTRLDLDMAENEIIEKYIKGETLNDLAREYKTSARVLRLRFDKYIASTGIDIDAEHKKSRALKKGISVGKVSSQSNMKKEGEER